MHILSGKYNGRFSGKSRFIAVEVLLAGLTVMALMGSSLGQEIVLDQDAIDFGKVLVGASAERILTISNEGTEDLIVSDMTVDNRAFAVDPTSLTIPADTSSLVSVTFTPGVEDSVRGVLTIVSNDADNPSVDVQLSGMGANVEAAVLVTDGYGDPGTSGNKVPIFLHNTLAVAGLNFVINFDPDILTPTEVVPADRSAHMNIFNENLEYGPGQVILVIADLEGDTIPTGSGPVATFSFDVALEAPLGEYPLTLSEVVLADFRGQAVLTDVVHGTFHVTGPSGEAWAVSLTATSSAPEEPLVHLTFGVDPEGSDGFDPDLDDLAAPPPPDREFWAYFSIEGLFRELSRDVRSSTVLSVAWTLVTGGTTDGTLTWDPESLPHDAEFELDGIDMREVGSAEFTVRDTITITYTYEDQTAPADVTDLQGLPGDEKATVTWTASVSKDVRGYKVYVDTADVAVDEIDVGDVTYYVVEGLDNLVTYTFTVTAYDEVGNESEGLSVDVVPNTGSYAIRLTLGSGAHDDTARVFFGADPNGSDGFDAGFDLACPPPPPDPPELLAYFPIDHHLFKRLCTDIRSSLESRVTWILVTEKTEGEICWTPETFPSGYFYLYVPGTGRVDMTEVSCAEFSAYDTLRIEYSIEPVSVQPDRDAPLPEEYVLVQNYPNPFNPETTIEYRLPMSGDVRVDVFNVLGQHVCTLIDETQEAGRYVVTWDGMADDGSAVSSGVYFYRLRAGKFAATKSMLLLK